MYRFFETIPGILAWATIALMVLFSWRLPTAVAIFIILFDIYWLFKTVYLSFHLRATFSKMRQNLKINWLEKLHVSGFKFQDIYHLVILPMYQEPFEIVKESFETLANTNYPKEKFIVVLATEERALRQSSGQADYDTLETAQKIKQVYGNKFFKFLITNHPINIDKEIPGKGSNQTWAAKQAKKLIIDVLKIPYENILISVFDVDTQVLPDYFSRLTYVFLTCQHPQHSSFQPIPLFTNNIFQTPALARVVSFSSSFWHMMQQSRPERQTTFSSHSMPFKAIVEIGFWSTDIVSEDSRIFWQCYLHYNGNWRVEPLLYPVSMDANVAPTFWQTMVNQYKQQRRWGWGCENIAYFLSGFMSRRKVGIPTPDASAPTDGRRADYGVGFRTSGKNSVSDGKKIPLRKKLYWAFTVIESFHSWATNALLIFALGWLPLALGGQSFKLTLLSYNLPQITRIIMTLAMVGITTSAILSIILLPPKPYWFKKRHYLIYFFQWILMPITLIIFGALPGLEAQTRLMLGNRFRLGFWVTPKHR